MTCAALGCDTQAGPAQLMCRKHWYQVPQAVRDEVWAAWRACKGTPDRRYAMAVLAARESLKKEE